MVLLFILWLLRLVAPQPAQCARKCGSAVGEAVIPAAVIGTVIVFAELQRRRHLLICQEPVAADVVNVIAAILQLDAEGFALG